MGERIPLRCRCGALRGTVELVRGGGQRVVCYCDDCQTYAHALGRADVLDAHGGTDLFQTRPSLVRIDEGADQLACLRLSPKGMVRWYARCCSTPIGNQLAQPSAPFVGMHASALDVDRDAALGAPIGRVQARFARNGMPDGAVPTVTPRVIVKTMFFLARAAIARGHRPSPFVDPRTGAHRATPEILSEERRAELLRSIAPA